MEGSPLSASLQNSTAVQESARIDGHSDVGLCDVGLCLEISRGQTEHPLRPMTRLHDKFLIGGDDDCDLQLGGDDIPALHSLLQFENGGFWIEAVAPDPQLFVNRKPVSSCLLRHDDLIEIGQFQLTVRLGQQKQLAGEAASVPATSSLASSAPHLSFSGEFDRTKIAELSAEELVDALGHEMEMIERFDRRLKLGAGALIDAVQQHRDRAEQQRSSANSTIELSHDVTAQDLGRVVEQINQTFLHFDKRSQNVERREAACLEAAALLLEVQERMAGQLAEIEQKLAELGDHTDRRHRASA